MGKAEPYAAELNGRANQIITGGEELNCRDFDNNVISKETHLTSYIATLQFSKSYHR